MEQNRAEQIASIRQLADLLEQHPDLPMPYELTGSTDLTIHFLSGLDPRRDMAAAARLIPGALSKDVWGGSEGNQYFDLKGRIGVLGVRLVAYRDQVCERLVTGTREVTKTVPDPDVIVPTIEVTEVVEDIEWVCSPLLSGQAVS